jgi:hypothetical protein
MTSSFETQSIEALGVDMGAGKKSQQTPGPFVTEWLRESVSKDVPAMQTFELL